MPRKQNAELRIVTFTTDFGLSDAYVAEMKAAVLRQAPSVRLIDVTHQIPHGDVLSASIALDRAISAFGDNAVHLAVVDPGVGSNRRALIAEIGDAVVVCPDNGLISWPWHRHATTKAHSIPCQPQHVSATFHGRDIFAPVAGKLAAGTAVKKLARPISDPVLLNLQPVKPGDRTGQIIHIDHFGNATTNFPCRAIDIEPSKLIVRVRQQTIQGLRGAYFEGQIGKTMALIGSSGLLEIAVRDGSAAALLKLRVGDRVSIG